MMSCRARRQREQPSAARTASSCARAAPRASTSPATLTQAIVRSSPTAPRSIHSRLPAVPTVSTCSGVTRADRRTVLAP